jgi:hypothetical protein
VLLGCLECGCGGMYMWLGDGWWWWGWGGEMLHDVHIVVCVEEGVLLSGIRMLVGHGGRHWFSTAC